MTTTAHYLVRRLAWDGGYSVGFSESYSWQGNFDDTVGPRHVPVATTALEKVANSLAHQLNAEARSGRSPFWFSESWSELTDLSPSEAVARLARKGFISPPEWDDSSRSMTAWREWWDRESVNWNEQELADAWAVFNKLRFYDVVEIEMED